MHIPNDPVLLKAYAIGLTVFEDETSPLHRRSDIVYRCALLMHNRAVRLGYSGDALKIWRTN